MAAKGGGPATRVKGSLGDSEIAVPVVRTASPRAMRRNSRSRSAMCALSKGTFSVCELGLAPGHVEEGGLEAGVDPHREHCAQQHQGLGGATPGKVVEQVLRQLRIAKTKTRS
jgi:hypothetical protein